jgi:hypothetical protein
MAEDQAHRAYFTAEDFAAVSRLRPLINAAVRRGVSPSPTRLSRSGETPRGRDTPLGVSPDPGRRAADVTSDDRRLRPRTPTVQASNQHSCDQPQRSGSDFAEAPEGEGNAPETS